MGLAPPFSHMLNLNYAIEPLEGDFAFILFDRLISQQVPIGVYDLGTLADTSTPHFVRKLFTVPGVFKITIAENVIGVERYHDGELYVSHFSE